VTSARLVVTRRSPKDVQTRQVIVSLDDEQVATLMFGNTYSVDLPPGHHAVRFNNTLVWKTIEFDASPGEHVHFNVVNRTGWGTWWMISLFGAGPLYLTVERVHIGE
jgi:hypothetical protein